MGRNYNTRFRKKGSSLKGDNGHFTGIKIFLPKEQFLALREFAENDGLPISALISYAIDNELETAQPFLYDVSDPNTVFVENAYIGEANKIIEFLKDFPQGLGRDKLLLFRKTIGIPDKLQLMLGLREGIKAGMLIQTTRKQSFNRFNYSEGYHFIRLADDVPNHKALEREKRRLVEKEERLARQKEKIKEMEIKSGQYQQNRNGLSEASDSEETDES